MRCLRKKIKEKPVDVQNTMMKSIAQQQILIKKREKIKWERQGLHNDRSPRREACYYSGFTLYRCYESRASVACLRFNNSFPITM